MQNRFVGIDQCRAIAILLVTLTHCMTLTGAHDTLSGPLHYFVELVLQLGTPIFLLLFGAMLELVYIRRVRDGHSRAVRNRLWMRAAQCYGYYLLIIAALFVFKGTYSLPALPVAAAFMISVPFSNLLAFYAAALAAAPALLWLRQRWGLVFLIALGLSVHILHPIISHLPMGPMIGDRDYLQYFTGFLYGQGVNVFGPSVLHGLTMVVLGMGLGKALGVLRRRGGEKREGVYLLASLTLVSLGICMVLWRQMGHEAALVGLTDMSLRIGSDPVYFFSGILGTLVLVGLCLAWHDWLGFAIAPAMNLFGRTTLFTFGFGTMIINIFPAEIAEVHGVWGATIFVFGLICASTFMFDHVRSQTDAFGRRANQYLGSSLSEFRRLGLILR